MLVSLGKEPSNLDSFLIIKEQINNLNRPDRSVDWKQVKELSEQISEKNGIDLQTFSYSTVADLKLTNNINNLIDSIEKISIVLVAFWTDIWPQKISARINILNWLNRQISDDIKMIDVKLVDIKDLYRLANSINIILKMIISHTEVHCNLANLREIVQEKIILSLKYSRSNNDLLVDNSEQKPTEIIKVERVNVSNIKKTEPDRPEIELPAFNTSGKSTSNGAMVDSISHVSSNNSKIFSYKKIISFILGAFIGSISCFFIMHNLKNQVQHALNNALISPLYSLSYIDQLDVTEIQSNVMLSIKDKLHHTKNIDKLKNAQDSLNALRLKIHNLQQELIQAEKDKKGITISHLKTAFYEIERELNQVNPIEQELLGLLDDPTNLSLKVDLENKLTELWITYFQIINKE
ncbi:type VI secretion system ImpA family N-terminal domain-containing protein [Conservatibacter flavescens]|uniref:ImpA N-terminal domain-containing protein n=1 Tax=Conservatibacter flavescens TaxID=28161 RepID=A0A2M8S2N8_9PAST|nr:type VI secretion system ImpA family N-terminal domain-containing protein [Conservatibacter flavescens]PJG85421.1 hypothetical protein CVP05_05955 [Conservatibacter flavescens]